MHKFLIAISVLASLVPTSCFCGRSKRYYGIFYDEINQLRALCKDVDSKSVSVDTYYYTEKKYNGEISMDIFIPEKIGNKNVASVCGYEEEYSTSQTYHLPPSAMPYAYPLYFHVCSQNVFEKGSSITLNITVEGYIERIDFDKILYFISNSESPKYEIEAVINIDFLKKDQSVYIHKNGKIDIASIDGHISETKSFLQRNAYDEYYE